MKFFIEKNKDAGHRVTINIPKIIVNNAIFRELIKISKKTKKSFFESFFYFSLVDDSADKTKFIINKYFSNHLITLENINFLEQCVYSNKYNILVNRVIDQCYKIKDINKLILIKGIK